MSANSPVTAYELTSEDLRYQDVETNSHSLEPNEFFPVLPARKAFLLGRTGQEWEQGRRRLDFTMLIIKSSNLPEY